MKTKNTKPAPTPKKTNAHAARQKISGPLAETINQMFVARSAERAAKAKLLTLMREDAKLTNDAIKTALIMGGYNEKSAENMTSAYRALIAAK